ncbi:7073_t:CDS:1, partial [Racocetra fulgida]
MPKLFAELIIKCWDAHPYKRPISGEIQKILNTWNNEMLNNELTEFVAQIKKADEILSSCILAQSHITTDTEATYTNNT